MDSRLEYLVYRCTGCGRLLTCLEIVATWEKSEREGLTQNGICPCGSGHIRPTNPKLWEEILLPRVWNLAYQKVFKPWLKKKLGR